jgi:hypothetical protein
MLPIAETVVWSTIESNKIQTLWSFEQVDFLSTHVRKYLNYKLQLRSIENFFTDMTNIIMSLT